LRFITFSAPGSTQHAVGVLTGDRVLQLPAEKLSGSLLELVRGGEPALDAVRTAVASGKLSAWDFDAVTLHAPIPRPDKNVYCVGRNYREHVAEGDRASGVAEGAPPVPIFFSKSAHTVIGHEQDVIHHRQTNCLDYEVELGIVIGRAGRDIAEADALSHIWGYTVINDVTARDLQDRHKQWFKGKSMDTFCPIGPVLVHASEIADPHRLDIRLRVNGETRQAANTREMIFNINRIIAELSSGMTLEAGDIIATGTCSGCAFGMSPPGWLHVGDVVEAEIEGIGILRNRVAAPA
jgi:2-keto-4-pentenoate hydratase/2-oxohepta-3-ene-1,7-dioic acid hydratase in catechol pathway